MGPQGPISLFYKEKVVYLTRRDFALEAQQVMHMGIYACWCIVIYVKAYILAPYILNYELRRPKKWIEYMFYLQWRN